MKSERGQALILVLVLLVVGALVTVPALQLLDTNFKARMIYGQFIKEDYAAEAATEYVLWKLKYESGYAASLEFGVTSAPVYVTINGVTARSTVTAEATESLSGFPLIDHQIKPTKTVTPTTAVPGLPETFTYTITLRRLEPDDDLFIPLQSIKDGTDAGFVYMPNSSKLDGVPFDDDDLTILAEPVIIAPQNFIPWSTIADEDSMVQQDAPAQNYGANLTMNVSSGGSGNENDWSFLHFDISSLPTGAGIVLQTATLRLWAVSYPDATRTYDLHMVTDNWTEGSINWNGQPSVSATASASADTASDTGTPMEWNVTSDVTDWADNTTANHGWRISDKYEGIGTGNYTSTVVDTLEYETEKGLTPKIVPVSGDVYAIAYNRSEGKDANNGTLTTVEISSSGDIADTVIDTFDFDNIKCQDPDVIAIAGDIYAIAYAGDGDDGFLKTVEILSSGNITDTPIETLEFDTAKGKTPDIVNVSGTIYAIAYAGDGDDGFLKTVRIKDDGTGLKVNDTLEFDTAKGKTPDIVNVSGDIYAIVYASDGGAEDPDDGYLKTVEIDTNGQINDTVIDTLEFDPENCSTPEIIPVSGDIYAIVYAGDGDDGYLKTVEIDTNGQIGTVIDTLEFDTLQGKWPKIIRMVE